MLTAFLRTFMAAAGVSPTLSSETQVIEQAEQDAQRMVNRGYRVVSSEWYELPFGLGYQKVVYELDRQRGSWGGYGTPTDKK